MNISNIKFINKIDKKDSMEILILFKNFYSIVVKKLKIAF